MTASVQRKSCGRVFTTTMHTGEVPEYAPNKAGILVAEDEASARAALVEFLREEGYGVRGAADGLEALGHFDRCTPDLVITDVHMPGMSGIELLEKIRTRVPSTGVIVMTADGTIARADDFLTKPIQFDELLGIVERRLRDRVVAPEHEAQRQAPWTEGDEIERVCSG